MGVLAVFLTGESAYAQQSARRIGIGAALGSIHDLFSVIAMDTTEDTIAAPAILIPLQVTNRFRLEPEIGVFRHSRSERTDYSANGVEIGVGVFPQTLQQNFRLYYGVRVGYVKREEEKKKTISLRTAEITETQTQTSDGFFVAPAVGGEYLFSDHFSLGAEVQYRHTSVEGLAFSTFTSVLPGVPTPRRDVERFDTSVSATRVLFVTRFYF